MQCSNLSVTGERSLRLYAALFAIFLILLLGPLLIATVPPLLDYPIHLARAHIVADYVTNPILQDIYDVSWRPIPNLAGDILMALLTIFAETEVAGRLMLGICLTLTVTGTILLYRVVHHEWSYWPFIAFLFCYHGALTAGFLNYSIGVSLLPFALAVSIWCSTLHLRASLAIDCFMALILLFCHVLVVGILAVYLTSYYLIFPIVAGTLRSKISVAVAVCRSTVPFILPAAIYMKYSLTEVIDREDPNLVGDWNLLSKIRGVAMPIMGGDILLDAFALVFVGLVFLLCIMSWKSIEVRKEFAIGSSLVFFIFVILPGEILDAAFIADRLPVAAALVGLAAIKINRIERRLLRIFAFGLIVLVAARASSLSADWQESDQYYRRLALSTEMIEPGSSVLIVSPLTHLGDKGATYWIKHRLQRPSWEYALVNIPSLHALPALLLAQRSTFSQLHFVWSDKQILSLKPAFAHLDYGDGGVSTWAPVDVFSMSQGDLRVSERFDDFDYILIVYSQLIEDHLIEKMLELPIVYSDDDITLIENLWSKSWLDRAKTISPLDR